jgi:PAS domain S-box-containing protein
MKNFFADFISISNELFVVANLSGYFEEVSNAWEKQLGWSLEELKSKPFREFVHPEDYDKTVVVFERMILAKTEHDNEVVAFQNRYRTKSGSYIILEWNSRYSPEKKVVFGVARNVTQQVQHLKFTQNIVDCVDLPIFAKDEKHRWIFGNKAFSNLIGKNFDEYYLKTDYDFFPKEQSDVFYEMDNYIFKTNLPHENEELLTNPNKHLRTILTKKTPTKDQNGNPVIVGVIRDITEQKNLDTDKNKLIRIIDLSPDFIFQIDPYGKITYKNSAAKRFLKSNKISDLYTTSEFQKIHSTGFSRAIDYGIWQDETYIIDSENIEHPAWNCLLSHKDQNGTLESYSLIVRDLRESKEQRLKLAASSKFASLGEMAGGIAHEINNPLSIITGKASLLEMEVLSQKLNPTKALDHLKKIQETAQRISKIIRGLRTFSRNAEQDPFLEVSLKTIIEDTLELCRERFRGNGVDLRVTPFDDISISCRATQIIQVLINLLGNAFDAVHDFSAPWVELGAKKLGQNRIQITVTDCGKGIPLEVASRLMEPFFTTKDVGKGTGLGLSISKGMIESHSGVLRYDPDQRNTTFVIELPIQRS